jgi:hypothetical protein
MEDGRRKKEAIKRRERREDRREQKKNREECSTAALGCDPACAWNPPSLLLACERPKEKIIHHGDTENTE